MAKITTALKTLAKPEFWLDALVIIGGATASNFLTQMVGSRLPLPAPIQGMVGPVLVIFAGGMVGERHGRNLRLGAAVNAAGVLLSMVGFGARAE